MFAVSQTIATLTPTEYDKEAAKQTSNFLAVTSSQDGTLSTEVKDGEGTKAGPVDMEL